MSTTACRLRLPNLIPPGSRSSFSRNIPAEVKGFKYNRDVVCGPFYSKFKILRRRGTSLSFREVVTRVEERFCRNLLRAVSQLHCPEAR